MYLLTRYLFLLSSLLIPISLAAISFSVVTESNALFAAAPWLPLMACGVVGALAAVVLCRAVTCSSCAKRALLVPDPSEPGNVHRPWARHCSHCSRALP